MNATTPKVEKFKTKVSTETIILSLKGVEGLEAKKITRKFKVGIGIDPKTNKQTRVVTKQIDEKVEPLNFPLTKVTADTLADYRKRRVPSFVLKVDEEYYYAAIPKDTSFVSSTIFGVGHQCAVVRHECHRLSAASDEKGGCAKVRNRSKNIEKYPWIILGCETFGTKCNAFVVGKCMHYKKCPPRKTLTLKEITDAKLGLAQFIWDDVKDIAEVRARKKKNKRNIGMYS